MEQNTHFNTEVSRRYSKALLRVANEDNSEQKELSENQHTNNELFDQDSNEDEDFEIPAFLRRQKF